MKPAFVENSVETSHDRCRVPSRLIFHCKTPSTPLPRNTLRLIPEQSSAVDSVEPVGVYEAVLPQTETLVGMGLIVFLCIIVAWVWSEKVVPVSRTNLAISKSRGEVKEYLDELRASDPRFLEATNSTVATTSSVNASIEQSYSEEVQETTKGSDRALERWLFTDWLVDNKSARKAGRQKEPALPLLKQAKWNSGDNPVVVAGLLMLIGLLLTAITERISSL
mmetsp:Transcript_11743/g.21668  ORF Transcript_11743/g.21668 Transcript_11743/m.21668 type:complete len:222 (-) Transcript_11743:74-739(-)